MFKNIGFLLRTTKNIPAADQTTGIRMSNKGETENKGNLDISKFKIQNKIKLKKEISKTSENSTGLEFNNNKPQTRNQTKKEFGESLQELVKSNELSTRIRVKRERILDKKEPHIFKIIKKDDNNLEYDPSAKVKEEPDLSFRTLQKRELNENKPCSSKVKKEDIERETHRIPLKFDKVKSETYLTQMKTDKESNEMSNIQIKHEHIKVESDLDPFNIKQETSGKAIKHQALQVETEMCLSKIKKEIKVEAADSALELTNFNSPLRPHSKRGQVKIEYDSSYEAKEEKQENLSIKTEKFESKHSDPYRWNEVLSNLREMRKHFDAPVDTMGCDKCHDVDATPEVIRYQQLLSLMLSSQTRDQVTYAAMQRLRDHGCNVENILATSDEKLGELIYPVGFWKSKVKYIKKTTETLQREYNCDIPNTVQALCKLSGVGPKMAHICMKTAWGQVTGIGVDTHVHRISNRLGWVNTKTPEETRKALEGWLPQELWSEVNNLLVGFGQQICQPIKPQCATCLNCEICPFGMQHIKSGLKGKKISK